MAKLDKQMKSVYSSRPKASTNVRKSHQSAAEAEDDAEDSESNEPKYAIPQSCKLEVLKVNKIEKLDDDYILIAHPFPQMEGEMILFQ